MNTHAKSHSVPARYKSERGFAATEFGLVLLVIAIMIAAGVWWYRDNIRKTSINENVQQLLHVSSNMISKYGQPGRYADVDTAIAVQSGVVPANLRDGTAATATNKFGGAITVAPGTLTGANDSVVLAWPSVTRNQCSDIVSGAQSEFRQINVGATTVKANNGDLDFEALETACDGNATSDLSFWIGRF